MSPNTNFDDVECKNESTVQENNPLSYVKYLIVGMLFGFVFVKAEIISWFRIYEMFHFKSFHMYGVIGSAVAVGALSMWIIKKYQIKTMDGEDVVVSPKIYQKGIIYGSLCFGIGWAITGACPGPIYAQMGAGYSGSIITMLGALLGTYCYGIFKDKLPH
jgi:uncharacterized membrane protein YedE/YeeE